MKNSTDFMNVEPCDLYIAMIYFLQEYNQSIQSPDINDLLREVEQFHITQWAFKEWQKALKATLINKGIVSSEDTQMHDMSKSQRWQFK